jgi:hypothetical protein
MQGSRISKVRPGELAPVIFFCMRKFSKKKKPTHVNVRALYMLVTV